MRMGPRREQATQLHFTAYRPTREWHKRKNKIKVMLCIIYTGEGGGGITCKVHVHQRYETERNENCTLFDMRIGEAHGGDNLSVLFVCLFSIQLLRRLSCDK